MCEDAKDLYNAGEVYKIKDGFEFWERLDTQLRLYVDRSYNGGLFDNKDKPILKEHRIANGRLTKCLVELSYNADKTGKYVEPIEYKDLSVRNLGSIYEGLLEYRLFIAEERMVQRKNKRKVKYLRAAEVRLQNADLKNIIEKGEIYLSQDAIERKETGSYYTPEDVVEYIVENTVGKKLNKIKNELLEQKKSLLEQLSYEPVESRKRMLQNQIDEITLDFINKKILSLSVIDSAMGSGHFLVNAAYRVANEIVEIIYDNAWESDNDKLNAGVKYWIRKVVEDCIYGIDINGLAVALARLSLWLISATNDKALSFIDHHLKEGNSIIGTDRKHVEIKDSKYPLFGISYDVFMEPILTKYEQLKKVGSNTKADVLRQQEIYEGIKQDIKIAKKKYDYYLASQYVGGIKDDIEYANLLMSNNIKAFQHKDMQKLWDIAREKKFFHWELEFPEVFQRGGFDIAIGNPPYVDVKEDDFKHTITESIRCKNLYAYMIENTINMISEFGHYGYIIPLSLLTSTSMYSIRRFIISSCSESWMSSYGIRPSKIFQNVDQRVCIIFGRKDTITKEAIIYTTKYILWNAAQRKWLFENIQYTSQIVKKDTAFNIYKISTSIEKNILDKILKKKFKLQDFLLNSRSEHKQEELQNYIYYHSAVRYWIKALDFVPEFINEGIARKSSKYKKITFKNEVNKYLPLSLINSSLFYWFWIITSDCRDLMLDTILNFRVDFNEFSDDITEKFVDLSKLLMCSYIKNSYLKTCKMATIGKVSYREFHPKYSKQIIDSIDDLLGQIYDFTEDEVEFIKNYDIRFRMGDEFTEEDE